MATELGKISIFLAKNGMTFEDVIDERKVSNESDSFKIREFEVENCPVKFFCKQQVIEKHKNPPWLDFLNEQLDFDKKVNFKTNSSRPSGLLLINIESKILAASFGMSGKSFLKKHTFLDDFGIKTAMNMCGNTEIKQTKSSTHSTTIQNIDRQLSKPSDAFSFGLNETEFLQYISAHIPEDKKITLQGKDTLTLKIIGDEKLSWDRLIEYGKIFIKRYESEDYKKLFPNYPNLQNIPEEISNELDLKLVENMKNKCYERIHLAIPEFIAYDEFSFSYTNYNKKQNKVFSHIEISQLESEEILNFEKLTLDGIKKISIYPYSHEQDQILGYKKWDLYCCIVAEIEFQEEYFVLSNGIWKKVDDDFYKLINKFVEEVVEEESLSDEYKNIQIANFERRQNREEIFNIKYCDLNDRAIRFDQAKLRIGQGYKDKEFCDILEYREGDSACIIHVKKYGGSDSINYLFSQAKFYCEFFLTDDIFLGEIREHIRGSGRNSAEKLLEHVKESQSDLMGKDYSVKLWILFDNKKKPPQKSDLPLMAKYDLKLTYERLRKVLKYKDVKMSMVPAEFVNFTTSKKKD
jgi:uncharacterized protein (TIGR04141 family)